MAVSTNSGPPFRNGDPGRERVPPALEDDVVMSCASTGRRLSPGGGAAEPLGLRAGVDDVGAIGEVVDQGLAQALVGDDLSPFGERQVGGDDHRRFLGPVERSSCMMMRFLALTSNGGW